MRQAIITVLCCGLLGCSQPRPEPSSAPAGSPTSNTGAEPAAGQATGATTAVGAASDSLRGLWVEYWAVEGHADTQGYALFEDGRFGWRAASGASDEVVRRWGKWSAEGETLVLRVQGEEIRSGCSGGDCRKLHEPPHEVRLELGECPPNDEAKSLDASYRCISIAGQAFWRREQIDAPTAYLPRNE